MTTSLSPQTVNQPLQAQPPSPAAHAVRRRGPSRILLGVLAVVLLFAATYAVAWFQANRLTARFARDAQASYEEGKYLEALAGYEQFDRERNVYVQYGGYVQVERIWSHRYSWPLPPQVVQARERVKEIIDERLTAEQAEEYIRNNTGKPAPYFADIYLRLGELYEKEGATRDARDVYEEIPKLFPSRKDLIERARAGLARLGSGG